MSLKNKVNIFVFSLLAILGLAIILTGYLIINQIIYTLYDEQFQRELNYIQHDIENSYETLEAAGVLELTEYVASQQKRVLERLRSYRFAHTGRLIVINKTGQILLKPNSHQPPAKLWISPPNKSIKNQAAKSWVSSQNKPIEKQENYYASQRYIVAGHHYFSVKWAALEQKKVWGWQVILTIEEQEIFAQRQHYIYLVSGFSFFIFMIVFILSSLLARKISHRIQTTLEYAERIAKGEHTVRIPTQGHDEITQIQKAVNYMVEELVYEIEQRRNTEWALEQACDMAEQANCAKSVFLANMSHELRTPLNAVLGYSEILCYDDDDMLSAEQREGLESIHHSGAHLLNLIQDILDVSQMEADRMKIKLDEQIFDFPGFLQNIISLTQTHANKKQIYLQHTFDKHLPKQVHGDKKRLQQILVSLLNNAIKFTHEQGTVSLSVSQLNDNKIYFNIHDTGIGIAEKDLKIIFQPFRKVSIENQNNFTEGTGLGLTLSNKLIELMGGELEVNSELGEGSQFSFSLRLLATENKMAA